MKIDKKSNINKLKDKIDIDKIKETKKEDLNLIKTIRLSSLHISINNDIANKYASILFPLTCLNYFQSKIKYSITTQNKIYLKIKITLVNILYELIKIRRIKSERKSN